jgi:cobyrinic acid a,c-diamide synthase
LPSRHLGLVTADAQTLSKTVLDRLGEALERHGSVDDIIRIAREAPGMGPDMPEAQVPQPPTRVRLGVAYDEAFHFYYQDNLEALQAYGCDLILFSPLTDQALPQGLDGIYLGGGYPEEHAESLAENLSMRESVKRFIESGRPVYAECGGLMYLSTGIETLAGRRFAMVGVLPGWTRMLDRLKSLGYVEVRLSEDSLFGRRGDTLRGHEFHYSELVGDPTEASAWMAVYSMKRMRSAAFVKEGFQCGNVLASYVHAHFASRPKSVAHFVSLCHNMRKPTGGAENHGAPLFQ